MAISNMHLPNYMYLVVDNILWSLQIVVYIIISRDDTYLITFR